MSYMFIIIWKKIAVNLWYIVTTTEMETAYEYPCGSLVGDNKGHT